MYVRVYDPNSEPFDVTRDRADRLILQDGWTQSKITVVENVVPDVVDEPSEDEDENSVTEPKPAKGRSRKARRGTLSND